MSFFSRKHILTLEAVIYIAANYSEKPLSSRDISKLLNIPSRYLEQLLQKLVHNEILRSLRGPKGGYILAKERRKITLADIIGAISSDDEEFSPENMVQEMILQRVMLGANDLFLSELAKITLAELCEEIGAKNTEASEFVI